MKIHEAISLMEDYGENTTLGDLVKKVQGKMIHKCPKCNGTGTVSVKYNAYPSGLPDSGWVEEWRYREVKCGLCNGEGYTEHQYKPKMIQDGWE